jgi:hypothetical protein
MTGNTGNTGITWHGLAVRGLASRFVKRRLM